VKILGKLNQTGKDENADHQFRGTNIEKCFDEIIHQHHHKNVAEIGSYEEPIFEFCCDKNLNKENNDGNQ